MKMFLIISLHIYKCFHSTHHFLVVLDAIFTADAVKLNSEHLYLHITLQQMTGGKEYEGMGAALL